MKRTLLLLVALLAVTGLLACAPRTNDPAEFITVNKQRELQLLGAWELVTLKDGRAPQPNERQTLTFQNDGVMKMDLWEHQLVYTYEVMPDPDHLRLTWTSSTNPNDKPGGVREYALAINEGDLSLDGARYKRTAMASGATVTPAPQTSANTATPAPQTNSGTAVPSPQVNMPTPTGSPGTPGVVNASLNEDFVLHLRETAILTDTPDRFGIMLYALKQDSRCPQGVTCVWAGEVRVEITFQENGLLHPPVFEMTTSPGDPKHRLGIEGYLVELTHAEPPAIAGKTIPPDEYALTFRVTRATTTPTPAPNTVPAALDQPVTLKMLQTLELQSAGLRVTLNGILEESRCPRAVNCAQAGRALVSFMAEQQERIGFFALSTSPPDGRTRGFFQGYAVELVRVEPYPETLDQKLTPFDYAVTVVVHQTPPLNVANKNEGFPLHVGQSATITDENVKVKFVRVSGDSRCPYRVACAVRGNAAVEATLEFADGTTQSYILNTDGSKRNERIPDTGNYGMELVSLTPYPRADSASQSIAQDEYEATFVVRRFASPGGRTLTPTGTPPTACAGLTLADAEAIMGQAVQPQTVPDVLIKIPADNESFVDTHGLCGYVSTVKNTNGTSNPNEPYEMRYGSHAAVTAARLSGIKALELVRIAAILRFAKPDADETPYLLFKTRLAAGDWDGLLETFQQVAQGSPDAHFETVDSFGDEGLWIWRAATDSNYAALLIRDKDTFVVVEALLDKKISESAAEEAIHAVMGQVME